ncbi:MAG: hypothetical protein AABX59_00005 [Nanoarchaeota archaeon]
MVETIEEKVDVSIFFKDGMNEEKAVALAIDWRTRKATDNKAILMELARLDRVCGSNLQRDYIAAAVEENNKYSSKNHTPSKTVLYY